MNTRDSRVQRFSTLRAYLPMKSLRPPKSLSQTVISSTFGCSWYICRSNCSSHCGFNVFRQNCKKQCRKQRNERGNKIEIMLILFGSNAYCIWEFIQVIATVPCFYIFHCPVGIWRTGRWGHFRPSEEAFDLQRGPRWLLNPRFVFSACGSLGLLLPLEIPVTLLDQAGMAHSLKNTVVEGTAGQ